MVGNSFKNEMFWWNSLAMFEVTFQQISILKLIITVLVYSLSVFIIKMILVMLSSLKCVFASSSKCIDLLFPTKPMNSLSVDTYNFYVQNDSQSFGNCFKGDRSLFFYIQYFVCSEFIQKTQRLIQQLKNN